MDDMKGIAQLDLGRYRYLRYGCDKQVDEAVRLECKQPQKWILAFKPPSAKSVRAKRDKCRI
jgi:hypothetical protein